MRLSASSTRALFLLAGASVSSPLLSIADRGQLCRIDCKPQGNSRRLVGDEAAKPAVLGAKRVDFTLEGGDSVAELLGCLLESSLALLLLDAEASCDGSRRGAEGVSKGYLTSRPHAEV